MQQGVPVAAFSSGSYRVLAAPGLIEDTIASYTLPAAWLSGGGREFARVIMRIAGNAPAGARVRLKLLAAGVIWTGPEVLLEQGHELQDLGAVQLPPGQPGRAGPADAGSLRAVGGGQPGRGLPRLSAAGELPEVRTI